MHHKISNSRKNFHLDIAHKLCDSADSIYVEDINFRVSAKGFLLRPYAEETSARAVRFLGKEMLDGGFGQFRHLLSWVCWKRGKYMGQVDHKYTSQICPECGTHTGKKELSFRVHNCSECGYSTSRDHASARVILNRGLEINVVPRDAGERKQPADCVLSGAIEPR